LREVVRLMGQSWSGRGGGPPVEADP